MLKKTGFIIVMIMVFSTVNAQNNPSPIIGTNLERGEHLRVLRLAVSCNGEYTTSVGGIAKAKQNLKAWLEQINEIYGREYSVRFELVPNNDLLIYTNPRTDPWPNMDGNMGCDGSDNIMNIQATVIDEVIGVANYDFSHVILGPGFRGGGCGVASKRAIQGCLTYP